MANVETISMQFHPRAFAAFGADLVTNDTVAVTELVKNCYDAFAYNVIVEFNEDEKGKYIQITDDGLGMTKDVIKNSWAVIATPYKKNNPTVERDGRIRRVSGNKGLGRFSAARLGNLMYMWTKSESNEYFRARINWDEFMTSSDMSNCSITLEVLTDKGVFNPTGTIIRIRELSSEWDKTKFDELRDNLSRMISPFKKVDTFNIQLISPFYDSPITVSTTELIKKPVYKITGRVNKNGRIYLSYVFAPVNSNLKPRKKVFTIDWSEAKKGFNTNIIFSEEDNEDTYKAGPFTFEIRGWDLDNDSLEDLYQTFGLKRRAIRSAISQYQGLSIYRDNVLVLPKSIASKDWLGIDLRRISSLGKRISTSQIVGIINISTLKNSEIRDTTDREKLVDTQEYKQFSNIIATIISQLENLRFEDKAKDKSQEKQSLSNLMAPLSAQGLVAQIEDAVERGEKYENILEYVRQYSSDNEKGLTTLQERLTYYAQTASLGSVAIVILHEVLTGMTVIKRFLRHTLKIYSPFDKKTEEYYNDAEMSHSRLIEVAKSFAPLYRKDLRKSKNECLLSETLNKSIRLISSQKKSKEVDFRNKIPENIIVEMFDGELQTVFVNLLDNACYWMQNNDDRIVDISYKYSKYDKKIKIVISDNGPGILKEDAQTIFEAGVTAKPHGIGMGLVIVTEILNYYDCRIATIVPGLLGGATFEFDLPTKEQKKG